MDKYVFTSLVLGSDHAGFQLKEDVKARLADLGLPYEDLGTFSTDSVDYPVIAKKVCAQVLETKDAAGILICGTGIGMSVTANRMPGIRAALCTTEFQARACRQHNDANVLCMGERVTGAGVARAMVEEFLTSAFEGGRHARRIGFIDN